MKTFKINQEIEIVCRSESTRSGFRHLATLFIDGSEVQDGKRTYQNRTWERYEFQSVLFEVVNKALKNKLISEEQFKVCDYFIREDQTNWSKFNSVGMVAQLGELFCDDQKDKNDWKKRMLKAGLPGLDIPEDWDSLDEVEKERRLNGVIKIMGEKK